MISPVQFSKSLLLAMGGIFGLLTIASLLVFSFKSKMSEKTKIELTDRIKSWWFMAIIFILAIVISKKISLIFFAFLSFIALKEFFSIVETRRADHRVLFWAYLAIPIQYYWIAKEWYGMFIIFIPVYMFLFLPMRMIMVGDINGFLKAAGLIHWGLMKTVFSVGHVAYLLVLPAAGNPNGGGAGLVLTLVVLTQLNDVFQYVWGKSFGRRKIVPLVSPNKTWAGFIGGVLTTVGLSFLISPHLTPLTPHQSMLAGFIIGIGGFVGDVVMSAVKRDLGIKDSGSLLPGHGGILDRIDSLMVTAPLFFHFVYYLYY